MLLLDLIAGEATVHVSGAVKERTVRFSDLALGVVALPRITAIGKLDVAGLIPLAGNNQHVRELTVDANGKVGVGFGQVSDLISVGVFDSHFHGVFHVLVFELPSVRREEPDVHATPARGTRGKVRGSGCETGGLDR
jgi:hypothetical protein